MRIPFISCTRESEADGASCHSGAQTDTTGLPLVAAVGCPNVGKSALFSALTGAYVTVSNFPGTTVEVSRGKGRVSGTEVGVKEIAADIYVRLSHG
jgi:ferrous iron transport protein B